MRKFLIGRGDSVGKGGDAASLGIFRLLVWVFYYILAIVFLFPLNVGVSHCFYCTFLHCAVKTRYLFKNVMEGSKAIQK